MTTIDILREKLLNKNVTITSNWLDKVCSGNLTSLHLGTDGSKPGIILFRLDHYNDASYILFPEDEITIHD